MAMPPGYQLFHTGNKATTPTYHSQSNHDVHAILVALTPRQRLRNHHRKNKKWKTQHTLGRQKGTCLPHVLSLARRFTTYIVMAYILMAYAVIAYIDMAYAIMAYIVMV